MIRIQDMSEQRNLSARWSSYSERVTSSCQSSDHRPSQYHCHLYLYNKTGDFPWIERQNFAVPVCFCSRSRLNKALKTVNLTIEDALMSKRVMNRRPAIFDALIAKRYAKVVDELTTCVLLYVGEHLYMSCCMCIYVSLYAFFYAVLYAQVVLLVCMSLWRVWHAYIQKDIHRKKCSERHSYIHTHICMWKFRGEQTT